MIRLTLPIPPGKNKTNRAGLNKAGRIARAGTLLKAEYCEFVRLATIAAGCYHVGMEGELMLHVWYWWPDERTAHDVDASINLLQDALAAAIGFNDRRVVDCLLHRRIQRGVLPHCEVVIEAIAEGGKK